MMSMSEVMLGLQTDWDIDNWQEANAIKHLDGRHGSKEY